MTLAQDVTKSIVLVRNQIVEAAEQERTDGWVPANQEMFREFLRLRMSLVHFAISNGMTEQEISDWAKIPLEEVSELLKSPLVPVLEVGALVRSKNPDRDPLHCGSGVYGEAVVISMEPFVMASESGDMRWSTWSKERVVAIGKPTPEALENAMRRLKDDE